MPRFMMRWLAASALLVAVPAAAQQAIQSTGSVAHEAARTSFPLRIGEFERRSVVSYDAARRDMSAEYVLTRGDQRLYVTVYVYPAAAHAAPADRQRFCRQSFDGALLAIRSRFPAAGTGGGTDPLPVDGSDAALRHRSVFAFRTDWFGAEQEVRSELDLYCYVGGDWLVKHRISGPATFPLGDAIDTFIRTGPWPGRRFPDSVASVQEGARYIPVGG